MPEMKKHKDIGERIKQIRLSLALTQHKMAIQLGVSSNYLSMLERGERNPSLQIMKKVAQMADISIDELLHGLSVDEDTNLDLYLTLSKHYQPKEVADALHFAQTYLEISKK